MSSLRTITTEHFRWARWERLIRQHGITIDRPTGTPHPRYPDIIYPLSYGYVNETVASDGQAVDVFVGTAPSGLVGLIQTIDHRQGDREVKLLYNCTPAEVYTAHGFINYDPALLEGLLAMRRPMRKLWEAV